MQVDCSVMKSFLTVFWLVVGLAIAGPIGFAVGRFKRERKSELTYRGPGGK